jgi:hypothetical protein
MPSCKVCDATAPSSLSTNSQQMSATPKEAPPSLPSPLVHRRHLPVPSSTPLSPSGSDSASPSRTPPPLSARTATLCNSCRAPSVPCRRAISAFVPPPPSEMQRLVQRGTFSRPKDELTRHSSSLKDVSAQRHQLGFVVVFLAGASLQLGAREQQLIPAREFDLCMTRGGALTGLACCRECRRSVLLAGPAPRQVVCGSPTPCALHSVRPHRDATGPRFSTLHLERAGGNTACTCSEWCRACRGSHHRTACKWSEWCCACRGSHHRTACRWSELCCAGRWSHHRTAWLANGALISVRTFRPLRLLLAIKAAEVPVLL